MTVHAGSGRGMAAWSGQPGGRARIRAAAASGLTELLQSVGTEPDRLLSQVHLTSEQLVEPAAWLPLFDYCQLFEQVAEHLAWPDFGLRFGLRRWSAVLGDLCPLATSAPTLHAAFRALAVAMPVHQEQSALSFDRHGAFFEVGYTIRDGHIIRRRQDAELTVGVLVGFARSRLGAHWAPAEVHFEHRCGDTGRTYDDLLGAPVYFGQRRNAMLITHRDAGAALDAADLALHARLQDQIRERMPRTGGDFVGVVLEEMRGRMAAGDPGIAAVAKRLGLSGPALYRRLRTCGVEFSSLRRDLRRQMALMHVADADIPLTEVAHLLGYSELSAFSRAFRSWTGVAAFDYRRRDGLPRAAASGELAAWRVH